MRNSAPCAPPPASSSWTRWTSSACSVLVALATLLTACPSESGPTTCPPESVRGSGRACEVDGECSGYLVCIDATCAMPEAMAGEIDDTTPHVSIFDGDRRVARFAVELAQSDDARARGLSGRPCMAEDWGMLFVYREAQELAFQTRQMQFPIDIVFIDAHARILTIHRDARPGLSLYRSGEPARYVLEVAAGDADELAVGQDVELPMLAP